MTLSMPHNGGLVGFSRPMMRVCAFNGRMRRMKKFSLAIFLICLSLSFDAQADWQTSMVRVLCMPEPGLEYFSVQPYPLKKLNEPVAPENRTDKNTRQDPEKHVQLDAQKFSYTCELAGHSYHIYGSGEPA